MMQMEDYRKARLYYKEAIENMNHNMGNLEIDGEKDIEIADSKA